MENRQQKHGIEHSSINKEMFQIDSPIDALEPNRLTTFTMR